MNEALKKIAYDALTTRPNFAYTLKEVESDLKRVFATGVCGVIDNVFESAAVSCTFRGNSTVDCSTLDCSAQRHGVSCTYICCAAVGLGCWSSPLHVMQPAPSKAQSANILTQGRCMVAVVLQGGSAAVYLMQRTPGMGSSSLSRWVVFCSCCSTTAQAS